MWNFDIGLTGLDAARKGLDVIGNNIANAATEGYHRQRVDFAPADSRQDKGVLIGGGVDVNGVTRLMDSFLELEILRQQSSLSQVSQESSTLNSIESAFGELTGNNGLNSAIDTFFNSLNDLSAHPDQVIYQSEVLTSAESMAGQFRTLGDFLNNLETQIKLQATNVVDQINTLSGQIAGLNDNIQRIEMGGSESNNLLDQRDQLIKQLSELAGVQTQQRDFGVVDVSVGGIPVVMGATTIKLEAGLNDNGLLGITPAGAYTYQTTVEGGQLGGLLALYNSNVKDIHKNLDNLALSIIQQVNKYHVMGVGSDGSFTELSGRAMTSENLSDFDPPVSDGDLFIRVTNTATGEVTRHKIEIDASADSLTTIATAISGIAGLSASVTDNRLSIQAGTGYKFDFLPAVLSTPTVINFTSVPPNPPPTVSVSGIYSGSENQTFTFTVVGNDSVGNGSLKLEVKDGAGQLVKTLNIGAGYAAGDMLDIGNGIKIAVSTGGLNNDDSFEVDAFANTDTSGLLAAIGINTFFAGRNASDIALADNVADSPGRIATSLGAGMTDNANANRLASVGETAISELDSMTAGQFYRKLVTDIGQQVSVKQMSQTSAENLMQSLANQQSDISGVDINDEAAQMLVFQQMFQAMAKYIGTVQTTLSGLFDLL
jgi:flagellar hook-associated protein 1 FlgK